MSERPPQPPSSPAERKAKAVDEYLAASRDSITDLENAARARTPGALKHKEGDPGYVDHEGEVLRQENELRDMEKKFGDSESRRERRAELMEKVNQLQALAEERWKNRTSAQATPPAERSPYTTQHKPAMLSPEQIAEIREKFHELHQNDLFKKGYDGPPNYPVPAVIEGQSAAEKRKNRVEARKRDLKTPDVIALPDQSIKAGSPEVSNWNPTLVRIQGGGKVESLRSRRKRESAQEAQEKERKAMEQAVTLAKNAGVEQERTAMLSVDTEYNNAYRDFTKTNSIWKQLRGKQDQKGLLKLAELKKSRDESRVIYSKKLKESVRARLETPERDAALREKYERMKEKAGVAKGFVDEKGRPYTYESFKKSELDKIVARYNGIVQYREIVEPAVKREQAARVEGMEAKERGLVGKVWQWGTRKIREGNENLEAAIYENIVGKSIFGKKISEKSAKSLSKVGARSTRLLAITAASAVAGVTLGSVGLAAAGLYSSQKILRGFASMGIGFGAGKAYEATGGKKVRENLQNSRRKDIESTQDIASQEKATREGSEEAIQRKTEMVGGVTTLLTSFGFTLASAHEAAMHASVQKAALHAKDALNPQGYQTEILTIGQKVGNVNINDADKLIGHFGEKLAHDFPQSAQQPPAVKAFLELLHKEGGKSLLDAKGENYASMKLGFLDTQHLVKGMPWSMQMNPGDQLSLDPKTHEIVIDRPGHPEFHRVLFDNKGHTPEVTAKEAVQAAVKHSPETQVTAPNTPTATSPETPTPPVDHPTSTPTDADAQVKSIEANEIGRGVGTPHEVVPPQAPPETPNPVVAEPAPVHSAEIVSPAVDQSIPNSPADILIHSQNWADYKSLPSVEAFTEPVINGSQNEIVFRGELFDLMKQTGIGPVANEDIATYVSRAADALKNGLVHPLHLIKTPDNHFIMRGVDMDAQIIMGNEYIQEQALNNINVQVLVEDPTQHSYIVLTNHPASSGVEGLDRIESVDASKIKLNGNNQTIF